MFDRDRFISVEVGLLKRIPVEGSAKTGMLQRTTKSVEVNKQVNVYISGTKPCK